jgi:hypothetical protein
MCGPPGRESSASAAVRAGVGEGWLDGDLADLYHLGAEVMRVVRAWVQREVVGEKPECVAGLWNSPRDWSGSKRTGNPIVLPVLEVNNEL